MPEPTQTAPGIMAALQALQGTIAREITSNLNHAVRRLRQAESRDEWIRTLNETVSAFYERSVFFPVSARGFLAGGAEMPLATSPAISSAVESRDTVVSAATAGELSEPVLAEIGEARRVWLTPVLIRDKAVGVLCAVPRNEDEDPTALELLASLAAASVVSAQETTAESKPAELVRIASIAEPVPAVSRPSWNDLGRPEQAAHLRAQRFARSMVAEWMLYQPEAIQLGRASANLYGTLKKGIEEARDAFRRQFIESCPSMVDYLHLEMVRSLAHDDSRLLGPDYPGPLP